MLSVRLWVALILMFVTMSVTQTDDDTVWQRIKSDCQGSQGTNLNRCNNTCLTCDALSSYSCASCEPQFILRTKFCDLDNRLSTYGYKSLGGDWQLDTLIQNMELFRIQATKQPFGPGQIVGLCKKDGYQTYMYGLFSQNTQVILPLSYSRDIDQIQIKMNFLSVIKEVTIDIQINQKPVFVNTINTFSNLAGTYALGDFTQNQINYLDLPSISSSAKDVSVIVQIDTNIISFIGRDLRIKFKASRSASSGTVQDFWGFNDVVIITRQCQSCVTDQVQSLIDSIGLLILIIGAVALVLIILLVVLIKVNEWKKKNDFQKKLGGSGSNLPNKAINRVLDNLASYRKAKAAQDQRFKKQASQIIQGKTKPM